jgi:hypothetical protein
MKKFFVKLTRSEYQIFSEKIMELGNSFVGGFILAQIFFKNFDQRMAYLGVFLLAFMYLLAYFVLLLSR